MSAIAFLRQLLDDGLDLNAAMIAADRFEQRQLAAIEARKAKDRERKKAPRNSTESVEPMESAEGPLPLPPSPQTPQPPTPTPGDISTRAMREREEAAFGRFWSGYPRKIGKADARKAFAKAWRKLPPMDEEPILTGGLERAKAAWTDAQFIPHAATWLNGERWQDEPGEVIQLQPRKAPHERHSPDAKFAARQANLATLERGADIAARFHGKP